MSRPWKSELRIRLRTGRCDVTWVRRGWRARTLASASAEGGPTQSLPGAIDRIRASMQAKSGGAWRAGERPAVRLTVPDERVYYAMLPAVGPWAQQQGKARRHFESALGRDDLEVRTTLLPSGRYWLAAAIESADLRQWQSVVDDAGARLAQLRPALADDLDALLNERSVTDALLVLLRDEGASLVRLAGLQPCAVGWLRMGTHDASALMRGVRAFNLGAPPARDDAPVLLLPQDDAQHQRWTLAAAHCNWELRAPLHAQAAEGIES